MATSSAAIGEFERSYGIELPTELVAILLQSNGGVPFETCFRTANGTERMIERFLSKLHTSSAGELAWSDLDVVIDQLFERLTTNAQAHSPELLPIAALFGGDFLCLDYSRGWRNPSVVVWLHEQSRELKPVAVATSNSFRDLLAGLYRRT